MKGKAKQRKTKQNEMTYNENKRETNRSKGSQTKDGTVLELVADIRHKHMDT